VELKLVKMGYGTGEEMEPQSNHSGIEIIEMAINDENYPASIEP